MKWFTDSELKALAKSFDTREEADAFSAFAKDNDYTVTVEVNGSDKTAKVFVTKLWSFVEDKFPTKAKWKK